MGVKVRWHKGQYYLFVNNKGRRKAYKAGMNEGKALKVAREMADKMLRGELGLPKLNAGDVPTLTGHVKAWIGPDGQAGQRCKRGTLTTYRKIADTYILPFMGDTALNLVTHEQCRDLINYWKKKKIRSSSLQLIARVLSASLTDAGAHLPVNPAFKLRKFFKVPDEIKRQISPFTRAESDKLLEAAKRHADPVAYFLFLIGLRIGLRHGELIALQWDDLNFGAKLINVQRNYDQFGNLGTPKHGGRFVDMSDELIAALKPLARKVDDATRTICARPDGKPHRQKYTLKLFHTIRKASGVPTRSRGIHNLRHTFASQLLQDGAPIHYVKEQCGHRSIQITVDLYGHLVPSENRKWVNRLTNEAGAVA